MAFAKIQELKLQTKPQTPKLYSHFPPLLPTPQTKLPTFQPFKPTYTKPIINSTNTQTTNQNKPQIQKLSQSQIQARREKGLCFYCDEKYTVGHNCRASVHVLIVPDYEEVEEKASQQEEAVEEETLADAFCVDTPQISWHAMSDLIMPQTLRFKGLIGKSEVQILVDRGSTHNFFYNLLLCLCSTYQFQERKNFM